MRKLHTAVRSKSRLSREQQDQIIKQLEAHAHSDYCIELHPSKYHSATFLVAHNVFRPDVMTSSRELSRFLCERTHLYHGKRILDMGCGTGVQGIMMGLNGAKSLCFSDVSHHAVSNTRANLYLMEASPGPQNRACFRSATVVQGDLFENIHGKFDFIVFNHPFFPDDPIEEIPISRSMLDEGGLIRRFFKEAKDYLIFNGIIIMPFFHFAGGTNNPASHAAENGFEIIEEQRIDAYRGLQQGDISIFVIR